MSTHPRERAAAWVAEAIHADVVVVESMAAPFSRVRAADPDMVIVCVDEADEETCRVLTMLTLDPATRDVPMFTWTKAMRDPEPFEPADYVGRVSAPSA